jgi:hypothetical protein
MPQCAWDLKWEKASAGQAVGQHKHPVPALQTQATSRVAMPVQRVRPSRCPAADQKEAALLYEEWYNPFGGNEGYRGGD